MVRSCHNCEVRFAIGGADKLTSLVASVMFVVVGVSASTCLPPYLSKGKKNMKAPLHMARTGDYAILGISKTNLSLARQCKPFCSQLVFRLATGS